MLKADELQTLIDIAAGKHYKYWAPPSKKNSQNQTEKAWSLVSFEKWKVGRLYHDCSFYA